jgi:thiol:disulfide interchange protein DsbD
MMKRICQTLGILLALLSYCAGAAPVKNAHVEAKLVPKETHIQPGKAFTVGLHLKMDPGWHTYYKEPGDSGLPTKIEWSLPSGFKAGEIQWPQPEKIVVSGLVNYGYEGEILLPVEIMPPPYFLSGPRGIEIKAKATWLACQEACIPGKAELTLTLPVSNTAGSVNPVWTELSEKSAMSGVHKTASANAAIATQSIGLGIALFFAFSGGLALNLMPCVLPVLSLKVLGLVKNAGEDKATVWKHSVAFTAGVVLSFWALAVLLLALRSAGEQLGWGFQMQSPGFVAFLTMLFFAFALNLFGVFEVGVSLVGADARAAQKGGYAGSFGTGALATIAATPCTAPLMGPALGFAIGQPAAVSLLVFTLLALGMASPYLVLGIFPQLLRFVPKPGGWMVAFKQFLGFLLLAAVVYTVWVFGQLSSVDGVAYLLLALIFIGLAGWVYGRWAGSYAHRRVRFSALFVIVVCLFAALALGTKATRLPAAQTAAQQEGGIAWETYSAQRVNELRSLGKPVFIDFTAAWCLSCKVNEAVTFRSEQVHERFRELGIVALKADWTRRDETITQALNSYGRSGVPLYVLYGTDPKEPPQILPEVITPAIVLEALEKMAK